MVGNGRCTTRNSPGDGRNLPGQWLMVGSTGGGARLRPRPARRSGGLHLLAKPTGAICNLDCSLASSFRKEEATRAAGSRLMTSCQLPPVTVRPTAHLR